MFASLSVSLVMLAGKSTAYLLTGSTALFADAAESVVHCAATAFSAFSLWFAARPADTSHPYGHGRIAYLAIGAEGTLVILASVAVIVGGIDGLWHGVALERLGWGLAIATGLALVNLVLAGVLIRVGRQERSELLVANGFHVLADVLTTAAAVVGLVLVLATQVTWLDPLAALGIGGLILVSGIALVRKAVAGLMDELDPTVSRQVIECLQAACERDQIRGFHQLKCRSLGDELWIAVHVQVPDALTVVEAHDRATRLEREVRGLFPGRIVNMLSHVEPEDHAAAHPRDHEPAIDPFTHQASAGGAPDDGTPTHSGSARHNHKG